MLELKTFLKSTNQSLVKKILSCFPENYSELSYIEPNISSTSVLFQKNTSSVEVINEHDQGIAQILLALRDEPKYFISRVKKTKYCEKSFSKAKEETEFTDYVEKALNELTLRRMSRSGAKEIFSDSERNEQDWNSLSEQLSDLAKRLTSVSVLSDTPINVLKAFDDQGILCFCALKAIGDVKEGIEEHIKFAETLSLFRGHAVLATYHSPVYSRIFKEWKVIKETPCVKDQSEVVFFKA